MADDPRTTEDPTFGCEAGAPPCWTYRLVTEPCNGCKRYIAEQEKLYGGPVYPRE